MSEDRTVEPQKVAMTAPVRTEQSQKVAMTSPVRTQLWGNDGNMKVSFVMPRKVTKHSTLLELSQKYFLFDASVQYNI